MRTAVDPLSFFIINRVYSFKRSTMTVSEYISELDSSRKEIISSIHKIMLENNKRVKPEVAGMMGKEMIQYKINGGFMYALSSVKTHMSLHALPLYGSPELRAKYAKLLNKAKFGKGCINFTKAEHMPLKAVKDLVKDCIKAEEKIIEMYAKKKK